MQVNIDNLISKILLFWSDNTSNSWNVRNIRKSFSIDELVFLFYGSWSFGGHGNPFNYYALSSFVSRLESIKNIFTIEEILNIVPDKYNDDYNAGYVCYVFRTFDDENCVKLLSIYKDKDIQYDIFSNIKTDKYRDKAMKYIRKSDQACYIVNRFDDEELRYKYLKNVPYNDRSIVVANFSSDYLKEKFLTIFAGDKATIIESLSSDSKKLHYMKVYSMFLRTEDKLSIIASFNEVENIVNHFHLFKNEDDINSLVHSLLNDNNFEMLFELSHILQNETFVYSFINSSFIRNVQNDIPKYINLLDYIKDGSRLLDLLRLFPDKVKLNYIEKLGLENRMGLVKVIESPYLRMESLKYVEKFSFIEEVIEHEENFPVYNESFSFLIDKYASAYNLNKDNLKEFVYRFGMNIFKSIKSDNLRNLINADKETIDKLFMLLQKKNMSLDHSSLNDILNSLLQREFKLVNSDIVLTFPNILHAIEEQDREKVSEYLDIIIKQNHGDFNCLNYLSDMGYTKETFIDDLFTRDQRVIEILHDITTHYIRQERDKYIKDNVGSARESCMKSSVNVKSLCKKLIEILPIEMLMLMFPVDEFDKDDEKFTETNLDEAELQLYNNRELLLEIIKYKKNPASYREIPSVVKTHMNIFNKLFEKVVNSNLYFKNFQVGASYDYSFTKADSEYIVSILSNLNVLKLESGLFSDEEMFKLFLKYVNQYRLFGWGSSLDKIFENAGLSVNSEIVANFMQYFPSIYSELEEKVKNGQLQNISFTTLFDLAVCFSSESNKFSYLFGSDNFKYISSNPGPNSSSLNKEKRISEAVKDLKMARERQYVLVPPLDKDFELHNNKKLNVVVGNFSNPINLTYGERTGACMRIGGAGSSLYDFCLENDSGFHIRFSNPISGSFVSRVSGFRNGNTIFLNQLRTSVDTRYSSEDVFEACKLVAQELIELSKGTSSPIDNVVVSPGYAVEGFKLQNLGVRDIKKGLSSRTFYTDVSESAVVLATSRRDNSLVPVKLGNMGVKKFLVQRDKVRKLYSGNCIDAIRHIETLDQVLDGVSVDDVKIGDISNFSLGYFGEDWYVAIDENGNVVKYIMKNSNNREKAMEEFDEALEMINLHLSDSTLLENSKGMGL